MLLPSAFQDKETMALGRKVVKAEEPKPDLIAAFERGNHQADGPTHWGYGDEFMMACIFRLSVDLASSYLGDHD